MKVIFVGLHHKPGKMPLCSSTKSGKLIDRIIHRLADEGFWGEECTWQKTNLFDVDYYPESIYDRNELAFRWAMKYAVVDNVYVLLGADVQKDFSLTTNNSVKVAHPASKRSHAEMDVYVQEVAASITKAIQKVKEPF